MFIKILKTFNGAPNGHDTQAFISGDVIELRGEKPEDMARAVIAEGLAKEIKGEGVSGSKTKNPAIVNSKIKTPPKDHKKLISEITKAIIKLDINLSTDFDEDGKPNDLALSALLGYKPIYKDIQEAVSITDADKSFQGDLGNIDLNGLNRNDLNDVALNLGIDKPEDIANIPNLKAAIEARIDELKSAKETVKDD